jgi:hypothetical protein
MARASQKGRRLRKKQNPLTKILNAILKHLASLGFTNRLAIYILLFLAAGLAGGFYLALRSIVTGYTGALMCWTVVFTPIGTACSIVLSRIVHKSETENTSADGDGIKYATAKANNFGVVEDNKSPAI